MEAFTERLQAKRDRVRPVIPSYSIEALREGSSSSSSEEETEKFEKESVQNTDDDFADSSMDRTDEEWVDRRFGPGARPGDERITLGCAACLLPVTYRCERVGKDGWEATVVVHCVVKNHCEVFCMDCDLKVGRRSEEGVVGFDSSMVVPFNTHGGDFV